VVVVQRPVLILATAMFSAKIKQMEIMEIVVDQKVACVMITVDLI